MPRAQLRAKTLTAAFSLYGTMPLRISCPMRDFNEELIKISIPHFCKRPMVFWSLPFLILLGGCEAKPECDSFETRNAVLQAVSADHNNALGQYAAKNST